MLTANQRQMEWLDNLPESPAKTIAREIADAWVGEGQAAAEVLLDVKTVGMVRWERLAISDIARAFRIKLEVTK